MFDTASAAHGLPLACKFPVALAAGAAAVAIVAGAGPAFARSPYDGNWSVQILTRSGACEPAIRYGVAIIDGRVRNAGGTPAEVDGRVSPSGAVSVSVQSGDAWATGSGRLRANQGGGLWRGRGASGLCEGTWVAERRNAAGEESGAPAYDYAPGYDDYSR